jgi:hypothetical protein
MNLLATAQAATAALFLSSDDVANKLFPFVLFFAVYVSLLWFPILFWPKFQLEEEEQ